MSECGDEAGEHRCVVEAAATTEVLRGEPVRVHDLRPAIGPPRSVMFGAERAGDTEERAWEMTATLPIPKRIAGSVKRFGEDLQREELDLLATEVVKGSASANDGEPPRLVREVRGDLDHRAAPRRSWVLGIHLRPPRERAQ